MTSRLHHVGSNAFLKSGCQKTATCQQTLFQFVQLPIHLLQMSPVKIDGAKRQLFSLVKDQNIKLLEAAQKKKTGLSPPAEASDAADVAAEALEADAAEADMEPEEEAEQVFGDGQKKKKRLQGKKEKSAPGNADTGSMGQTIKRKRKEDNETKVSLVTVSATCKPHKFKSR